MNNKDKEEFFEKFPVGTLGSGASISTYTDSTPEALWQWIESKKEEWEKEAYIDGYYEGAISIKKNMIAGLENLKIEKRNV
jgi:hypothetical protein